MTKAAYIAEVAPTLGRKNLLINPRFLVWQRDSSISVGSAGVYTADRWRAAAATANVTISRAEYLQIAGASGNSFLWIEQRIEQSDVGSMMVLTADDSVTVTLQIKSNAAKTLDVLLRAPSAKDNWTSAAAFTSPQSISLPGDSTYHEYTLTFPLTGWNYYGLSLYIQLSSGLGSGQQINIKGAQLEKGEVATPLEYRSYGEELALCLRYYERRGGTGENELLGPTVAYTATTLVGLLFYFVQKRVDPVVTSSGTLRTFSGTTNRNLSITSFGGESGRYGALPNFTTTGLTVGDAGWFDTYGFTSSYIAADAEL